MHSGPWDYVDMLRRYLSTARNWRRNQRCQDTCQEEEQTNGVKNLPRRITAKRNQWHQESARKNYSKKKPIASRIRREDIEEETNGVKNPPRRHLTAKRNQWRQESAQKTPSSKKKPKESRIRQDDTHSKKKTKASRHQPRRNSKKKITAQIG